MHAVHNNIEHDQTHAMRTGLEGWPCMVVMNRLAWCLVIPLLLYTVCSQTPGNPSPNDTASTNAGACVATGVLNNQNLRTCSTMLAVSSPIIFITYTVYNTSLSKFEISSSHAPIYIQTSASDPTAFCALSCVRDIEALYNTCNFTPNPISTSKSL